MTQIFLLKSVYSVGMLAFEIPSGYFGDIWGRKKTLIVGTFLLAIGFSVYSFSFQFWQFLIAELVLGIGQSFISGSDSAMLYDTLKSKNREGDYLKYEGRVTSVGNFSEAFAGIFGGLLATISLRTPFVCQVFISAISIPAALTLIEPDMGIAKRVAGFKDIFKIVKYSIIDHSLLRNFILFSSLMGSATLTYAWFIQPLLVEIKVPVALFGVIWTVLNLIVGVFSIYAHRIERNFTQKKASGLIYLAISIGFILTACFISIWVFPILILFYIVRGVASPVLKDYINTLIDSEVRATVLSLRDMFIRIIFAMTGPILGWITDNYSLKSGLMFAGFFFLITGSILYYFTYFSSSSKTNPS